MRLREGYILIADMVGFSQRTPREQAELVADFVQVLVDAIDSHLAGVEANVFPTGDGAIVAAYEDSAAGMAALAPRIMQLAMSVLRAAAAKDYELKVSVNVSNHEALVDVSGADSVHASVIQIGNGINLAERILNFAEPREIVATEAFYDTLVNSTGGSDQYSFAVQPQVFVKHMRSMVLFIYSPRVEESSYISTPPEVANRRHKRYAYFPPMKQSTLDRFREVGLETDILQTVDYVYETIAAVNRGSKFISWASVDDVVSSMRPEDGEEVCYLERAEYPGGPWTAEAISQVVRGARGRYGRPIRLFLSDPNGAFAPSDGAVEALQSSHGRDNVRSLNVRYSRASRLRRFRFGATLYPARGCLVAPIPAPNSYDQYLELIRYTEEPWRVFDRFQDRSYGPSDDFKAFVVADRQLVSELVGEFRSLFDDPMTEVL